MTLKQIDAGRVLAAALGIFILYTSAFGPFVLLVHRSVFLGLIVLLGLVVYPAFAGRRFRPLGIAIDAGLAAVAVAACLRVAILQDYIMMEFPAAEPIDIVLAWGLVLTVLELCRRAVGWLFTLLVAAGLLYALFGDYAPGSFQLRGFSLQYVTETLYFGDLGIWGSLVGISATILAAFILFGSLLLSTGAGQSFIDIATRIGGATPGGAGKVAVIASGFFGMLAGSSVANVATTGNITIPMMKRLGYPPALAAAIEAVASTGGQLAPPILGAAAFVMAEFLGIGYWTIVAAAIVPALLYYLGLYCTIHAIAVRTGLATVEPGDIPTWGETLAPVRSLPLLMGLGGIAAGVYRGNSIVYSVFFGIAGLILAYVFAATVWERQSPRQTATKLWQGIMTGAHGLVLVGVLLAGAQILVSMMNMTGLAGTISAFIVGLAGEQLFLLAVLAAVISLVMGMGLPTVAAYVLVAAMMIGPLERAGVPGLSAHMFVLYYAALSAITPPVCVAVFIASGIAGTRWTEVARDALRLGAITYLLPFLFLYYPGILAQDGWTSLAYAAATGVVLTVAVAGLLSNWRILAHWLANSLFYLAIVALAVWDHIVLTGLAAVLLAGGWSLARFRGPCGPGAGENVPAGPAR